MRVLVTGAAGFIGSHTCEKLMKRGDSVVAVDVINDYYDVNTKNQTISYLKALAQDLKADFIFHKVDFRSKDDIKRILDDPMHPIDRICHLGAQAGVRYSVENVEEVIDINIMGTITILEAARKKGIKDLVIASSSSVYGQDSLSPFSESAKCDRPISPYAASKRACELFGHTYFHLYNFNVTMLRFFSVYGPRGRPDMACLKFIDKIHNDIPIDKYGDGSAVREFTYIDDIIQGVLAAIDLLPKCRYEVVNLGGGCTHALNEFIACVEKHVGKKAIIKQMPDQMGDVPLTSADQDFSYKFLGFEPKWTLDKGIEETVKWYRQNKQVSQFRITENFSPDNIKKHFLNIRNHMYLNLLERDECLQWTLTLRQKQSMKLWVTQLENYQFDRESNKYMIIKT